MAGASREPVKVVLIETRYVETDATSFKSVVQNLTGKDSCVAARETSSFSGGKRETPAAVNGGSRRPGGGDNGGGGKNNLSRLTKGMSFKDLDNLILQAPPVEELRWLWE